MKLWLQVLFAQGYLWRDRYPDFFSSGPPQRPIDRLSIAWGVLFLVLGPLFALTGSVILGLATIASGTGSFAMTIFGLGVVRRTRNRPFWFSVAWTGSSVALLGILISIISAALIGFWLWSLLLVAFLVFCAAGTINEIQRRYLFFADPRGHPAWLTAQRAQGIPAYWVETFWRLPWEVLQVMIHGRKAAA